MSHIIKISKSTMTVNGQRCGITFGFGPWRPTARHPEMIKIRPKRNFFPADFRDAIRASGSAVENHSDMMTDCFQSDEIVLVPGHPLYETVRALR
jgi:hypothetical protein